MGTSAASLALRVERHQRLARAVQYFNLTEPDRLTRLVQAIERYEDRLKATGLSDEVVRQRHPALALWVNFVGVLKSSALIVLNLYGWANSLIPRWTAYLLRPLGRRREPLDPAQVGEAVQFREALWGTYGGWYGAAVAFPMQTYLVYRLVGKSAGPGAGALAAALYALSLIPSWRLFVHRRDILRQHYVGLRDAVHFLLKSRAATKLHRQRRRLQRQVRSLLAAYDALAPRPS